MRQRSFSWRRAAPVALACALAAAVLVSRPSWASDHEDAPSLVDDRGADIADVYAFMRPGGSTHLVLAMTVHPNATTTTLFDEKVEYVFHVFGYDRATGYLDPTILQAQVACRFASASVGPQRVVCSANGVAAETTVGGDADAGAATVPVRVFAGLRADPDFADIAALQSTVATGQLKLNASGTNAYAGKNVLALVVEVSVDDVLLAGTGTGVPGSRPLFAVSASTERLP